ncbi:MAG: RNA-binding S4 domain-containing protein [Candidatus Cloacimonetes bacterium]|nr:RNA-binding S4 domain-containing protein [Candidatus Cloacimonadota bacterium]
MKFQIKEGTTIYLYQLLKAAGVSDDYVQIRHLIQDGRVKVNEQVELKTREILKVGDSVRYGDYFIQIIKKDNGYRAREKEDNYEERVKHGSLPRWQLKTLSDQNDIDGQLRLYCRQVHEKLLGQGKTLALAESCTGGMAAQVITSLPGASNFFLGGLTAYSNQVKNRLLEVKGDTLEKYGAVSRQTALEMVQGTRKLFQSVAAGAVTGIAGPGGGSTEKPVGTVFIAVADNTKVEVKHLFLKGSREEIRKKSVLELLKLILENL